MIFSGASNVKCKYICRYACMHPIPHIFPFLLSPTYLCWGKLCKSLCQNWTTLLISSYKSCLCLLCTLLVICQKLVLKNPQNQNTDRHINVISNIPVRLNTDRAEVLKTWYLFSKYSLSTSPLYKPRSWIMNVTESLRSESENTLTILCKNKITSPG